MTRFNAIAFVGFACFAACLATSGLTAEQATDDFRVSTSGPRALADALRGLSEHNDWVITYEDPQWLSPSDRVVAFPSPKPGAPPIYGIRDSVLNFSHRPASGLAPDAKALSVVQAVLNEYRTRQNPADFVARRVAGLLHVIPSSAPDATGESKAYSSPLDRPLSWQALVDSHNDSFDGVLAAISAASGQTIVLGQPNVRIPARLKLAGPAPEGASTGRMILSAAIKTLGPRVTWHIYCQPGVSVCAFNVIGW